MSLIEDQSVNLIVTSPPYWQLKDYGTENQIGFHSDYQTYINHLNIVWTECYRVLHNGCRLCINIGDQFARAIYYGRYKVIPIREEIIKFCEAIGFDYMGAVIWQKVTTSNSSGGGVQMGSYPYPRNGILKIDYEFVLVFKKLGDAPKPTKDQKELSVMTPEEWNTFFAGHWYIKGARQNEHIAVFPEEIPHRLIKMFSFVGETVLDPFLGSGTTTLAAKKTDRNSIGYEINETYIPIIRNKIGAEQMDLNRSTYEFIANAAQRIDFERKIADHPYVFVDRHEMNKKIDVKKMTFGSKIDSKTPIEQQQFYTIKEVLTAERVLLSNNLIARLIGVKADPFVNEKAEQFLRDKTKGKRVFLRFDSSKYDEENNLLVYLYLENKTFLNAHLIKQKLARVDETMIFAQKNKFLTLQDNG